MMGSADDFSAGGTWVKPGGDEVPRADAIYYYVDGRGYFNLKSPELGLELGTLVSCKGLSAPAV